MYNNYFKQIKSKSKIGFFLVSSVTLYRWRNRHFNVLLSLQIIEHILNEAELNLISRTHNPKNENCSRRTKTRRKWTTFIWYNFRFLITRVGKQRLLIVKRCEELFLNRYLLFQIINRIKMDRWMTVTMKSHLLCLSIIINFSITQGRIIVMSSNYSRDYSFINITPQWENISVVSIWERESINCQTGQHCPNRFSSPWFDRSSCRCTGCDPSSISVTNPNQFDRTATASTYYTNNNACDLVVLLCHPGSRFNIIYKSGVIVSGQYSGPILFHCTSCLSNKTLRQFDDDETSIAAFPIRTKNTRNDRLLTKIDSPVYANAKNRVQITGCYCSMSTSAGFIRFSQFI